MSDEDIRNESESVISEKSWEGFFQKTGMFGLLGHAKVSSWIWTEKDLLGHVREKKRKTICLFSWDFSLWKNIERWWEVNCEELVPQFISYWKSSDHFGRAKQLLRFFSEVDKPWSLEFSNEHNGTIWCLPMNFQMASIPCVQNWIYHDKNSFFFLVQSYLPSIYWLSIPYLVLGCHLHLVLCIMYFDHFSIYMYRYFSRKTT